MSAPGFWDALCCDWWGMSREDSRAFWRALEHSRFSLPREFRQKMALLSANRQTTDHFLDTACSPANLMNLLDALWRENRISRSTSSRWQDLILRWVDDKGQWKNALAHPEALERMHHAKPR